MRTERNRLEKPTLGYVVIAVAFVVGTVAANAFGQPPSQPTRSGSAAKLRFLPPTDHHHPLRRWILGVQADPTATGFLVRHVEPHSAAGQIGLEPGDRLVAIDGQQIGYIGHRLVRLSDTLERQGGRDGRVQLLIQNRRNHRLISLPVKLRHPANHLGH